MDILGPDIFEIVKDYANNRSDYEYFIKYKDYTNAIIIKLKEGDYKEVISLVNKKYHDEDVNWGKILGYILDTNFRDSETIIKILRKTQKYSYFAASLIKHDMKDCFKAIFRHVLPEEKDLEMYARSLGYIFYSKNYDYFYDEVFEKLTYVLKHEDEDTKEDFLDLDFYSGLPRLITSLFQGLSYVNFRENKEALEDCLEYQDRTYHCNEYCEEIDSVGITQFLIHINGGIPLLPSNYDKKEIEKKFILTDAGYSKDFESMLKILDSMYPKRDEKKSSSPILSIPSFIKPPIIDPRKFTYETAKKERDEAIMYILLGAVIGNRQHICEKLLDILEDANPDTVYDFITDTNITISNIFYEQRMSIPILFLKFIQHIFKNDNELMDSLIDEFLTYSEKYENYGLSKYMTEQGLEFKDVL